MSSAERIRLNRFLAQLGVGSRRTCDALIAAGKVRVDGRTVAEAGITVIPGQNSITVDGVALDRPAARLVLLLHKPTGVVSTVSDPEGRPTVLDLCRPYGRKRRLFPVGRLDVNTTGALLLTNDGILCYRLTHPKFALPRTYVARVRGEFDQRRLERLRRMSGLSAGGRPGRDVGRGGPSVEVVKQLDKVTVLRITLIEGRNRQVRRMCEAVGLRVGKLKRVAFGPISIRDLPLGAVRPLTESELKNLDRVASLAPSTQTGRRRAARRK
jgi:23S rRNA pseudouridine2605 synthase